MFIDEQGVVIRKDNRCDPREYTKSIQTSMIIFSMGKTTVSMSSKLSCFNRAAQ
jgi:hypothetical protein